MEKIMNKYFFILFIFSSIFLFGCMNDLNPEGGWSRPIITNDNMVIASSSDTATTINSIRSSLNFLI